MSLGDDYASVMRAYSSYSIAIDRQQWSRLADAFTDDAVWQFADGTRFVGLDAIREAQPSLQANRPAHTLHLSTNVCLTFDGDQAESDADWIYYGARKGEPWNLLSYGFYDDKLVRTEVGWRLRYRRIIRALED